MKLKLRELTLYGVIGGMMYALKVAMEIFPNVHPVGIIIVALTVVFRKKALYPIYTYVLLCGAIYPGFGIWWIPQLYLWLVLWGGIMLIPKNISEKKKSWIYIIICSVHGFIYGLLYTPPQALFMGMSFNEALAWYISGVPWDIVHGVGNFVLGGLIVPLISVLKRFKID